MSSKEEYPLESNTTHSPREIYEWSNKIKEQDNVGPGVSSNGVSKDLSSSMQARDQDHGNEGIQSIEGDFDGQVQDQDHHSEGMQSLNDGSNEPTQGVDIDYGSYIQATKNQDHHSEGVQLSEGSPNGHPQEDVDIDHGSYIQAIKNQDHHIEGMQPLSSDYDGQTQDIDHDSYMQVIKDQDHRNESAQSLEDDRDERTQAIKDEDHCSEDVKNPCNERMQDQDYHSESMQSLHNSSDGQTQGVDINHGSYIQALKDQDHHSENVQSLKNGRTQSLHNLSSAQTHETRKLARTASAGATAENSTDLANKIRHFRTRSTVSEVSGKLPLATSQGDNSSGNSKWPTVTTERIKRSRSPKKEVFDPNRVDIDTKAPIDSVKSAVSKFGGILDWKAHKVQTVERSKVIDEEIEKVQEEIPLYKEQAEIAEQSKVEMVKELENTKRLIEELKLSLEKAETEESQAQQDSQVAKLRLEEIETGVGYGDSVADKTELEMAKNRHQAAITDLKAVKDELESVQKEFAALFIEKDEAVGKEEEAVCASKEMEKTVETLTVELVSMKEALESANAAHLEAEERRICELVAKDQDLYTWDKELEEAQENLVNLNQQVKSAKEVELKLSIASSRVAELKTELATYTDPKTGEDSGGDTTHVGMKAVTLGMNNELNDMIEMMDKTSDDVNCLRMASTSLKGELEKEQSELIQLRQREGMASIAVASLEAELDKIKSEIAVVRKREKEARDKMEDLPRQLKHASEEAQDAKTEAELAQQEMKMAKEEAEIAKERVHTLESQLLEARKEIEAIRASERLALAAIKAFQESESTETTNDDDLNDQVTLAIEEYYELSKKAHEAEEEANAKVAEAISKIETAKEDELKSKKQLEDTTKEVSERKEVLRIAQEKAEKAQEGKVEVEQELRKRRLEHEEREKEGETGQGSTDSPTKSGESQGHDHPKDDKGVSGNSVSMKKKKKSFFPRFLMFFSKKHWKSSSKS